uniref:hypothetical protein n=1 Tax=Gemmatimonas sp. TaxID=1962908 RepID=UPI0037C10E5F
MITQPTATIDAVATPSSLTERGPRLVATTRITHVPSQVPQACARRFRTDTEDVIEVREQGSAVELPLVAYSGQSGHLIRFNSARHSGSIRPPRLAHFGQGLRLVVSSRCG